MMAQENVYRDDWKHLEQDDEYAPAQVGFSESEGSVREVLPSCKSCWTSLLHPDKPCPNCGRPPEISDVEWFLRVFSCQRCGHDLRTEDEGGCPECGAMAA